MNRLEKFIKEHREEFNDLEPSEQLWQRVESATTKKSTGSFIIRPWLKWGAAAAVLVMIAGAFLIFPGTRKPADPIIAGKGTLTTNLSTIGPEEAPQVNQFAKMIAVKQEELKSLAKEQPALYNKFAKDITQLDSSYNILKNKLSVTPNREVLIEAMIQNLELQLNVLNQQLKIINQIKHSKKYSHEKNQPFI